MKGEFIYIDTSLERTRMQFYFADPTALTFEDILGTTGFMNDIRAAINDLTLLNEVSVQGTVVVHSASPVSPNNASAQREYGVKLFWTDDVTGESGHTFIPGIDPAYLPTAGDQVNLAQTQWAALVTAVEAGAKSKAGNAITVTKGVVTGRRA